MRLSGRAVGGPRDGVRLDAPEDWDGRLVEPHTGRCCRRDGYYAWAADEAGVTTWRWVGSPP